MNKISEYNLKLLLEELGKYSSRMAGYYEHFQAYNFIKNQLSDYIRIDFNEKKRIMKSWLCEYSTLYYEDEHMEIEHYPLVMSPSGSVLADTTILKPYSSLNNLDRKVVIAFCNSARVRNMLCRTVHKKGGLALVFVSTTPGFYVKITRLNDCSIPAMVTSLELGLEIAKRGGRVYLYQETRRPISKVVDLVAELGGGLDEEILIYSHYDSIPYSNGATDDAAGTAVLLELMRVLKNERLRRPIRFYLSGCGELGGFKQAKESNDKLRIIVDSIGLFYTKLSVLTSNDIDKRVLRLIKSITKKFDIDLKVGEFKGKIILIRDKHNIVRHTPEDTVDKVGIVKLRYACNFLYTLIKEVDSINF